MLLVELNFARPLTSPTNFFCELSQYIIFSRISDFRKIFELAAFKVQLMFRSASHILMKMMISMGMLKIYLRSGSDSDPVVFCLLFLEIGGWSDKIEQAADKFAKIRVKSGGG